MIEFIKNSIAMWIRYWNDGFYQYLLLIAVLYLLWKKRSSAKVKYILAYLLLTLITFFCPITAKVISACIGNDVYWRVLWLLPLFPVIALAGADFISAFSSKKVKLVLVVLCTLLIAVSGRDMFTSGDYYRLANNQKVPNEVAAACNIILEKAAEDHIAEVKLASDDWISAYVRVYDASIRMPYARAEKGALTRTARRLSRIMNAKKRPRYRRMARRAEKLGCNFLIVRETQRDPHRGMKRRGWYEIGMAGSYTIFQFLGKGAK